MIADPERERRAFEELRAKYGLQMRVLDLVSRIGGWIGRRVVLEVVFSESRASA